MRWQPADNAARAQKPTHNCRAEARAFHTLRQPQFGQPRQDSAKPAGMAAQEFQVVILAGGLGSVGLYPLAENIPKVRWRSALALASERRPAGIPGSQPSPRLCCQ